jgi:hypothetical protein
MVCQGGETDKAERNAISITLRANAVSNVGFREYERHAAPMIVQNRKGDCA